MLNETIESRFKSWLVEHQGTVLKVAKAYTLNNHDCQDLAQEILLQIWLSLPQFQGRADASTWFYRVALNTAISWHRKERRRQTLQQPILGIEEFVDFELDRAERVLQRELVEQLYVAIRKLPKTDAALVLLHLDDMTYCQMAEVLGISESNVGVKLNRAKKALGELLKDESHES